MNGRILKDPRLHEIFWYCVSGALTAAINIGAYSGLLALQIDYRIANIIALVLGKSSNYVANKRFVFKSKSENTKALFLEMLRFVFARGFTGLVDYFGLILLAEVFFIDEMTGKVIVQIVVIVLNYILSKFGVFKKTGAAAPDNPSAPKTP